MAGKVNWSSIQAKLNNAAIKKIEKKMTLDMPVIASEFVQTMDFEIADSPGMTIGESERVSMTSFQKTGGTFVGYSVGKNGGTIRYRMNFDFTGDKTLVSLSPYKSVHNLVALFNNGYPTNNVNPNRPIKGMWHGRELVIRPRSRQGAHFIGRAIQQFKQWCATYYREYKIDFEVNPIYSENV